MEKWKVAVNHGYRYLGDVGNSRSFLPQPFRVVDQLLAAMEVCGCMQPYDASWER
jgi:hypothetical protein